MIQRMSMIILLCCGLSSSVYGHEEQNIRGALQRCNADFADLAEKSQADFDTCQDIIRTRKRTMATQKRSMGHLEEIIGIQKETIENLKRQLAECQAGER